MSTRTYKLNRVLLRTTATLLCGVLAALLLAGCVPAYNTRSGYGPPPGSRGGQCYQGCGYVRSIRQVPLNNGGAVLGTVIGAVVGGLLGNQVGGGSGKTLATVAGAAAGGYAGHEVAQRRGGGDVGWQIGVELNNGQYATVTQHNPPRVQIGDYVMVRNNEIYRY